MGAYETRFKAETLGNVRASEGAGTTALTASDSKRQVFNLSANRTVVMPSTGVKAGDVYQIERQDATSNVLTIQSSSAATIATMISGTNELVALIDAPTSAANWTYKTLVGSGAQTFAGQKTLTSPMVINSDGVAAGTIATLRDSNGVANGFIRTGSFGGASSITMGGFYPGTWLIMVAIQSGNNKNSYRATLSMSNSYEDTSLSVIHQASGSFWGGGAVTFSAPGSTGNLVVTWNGTSQSTINVIAIGAY